MNMNQSYAKQSKNGNRRITWNSSSNNPAATADYRRKMMDILECGHRFTGQACCGRCQTCWECCKGHEVSLIAREMKYAKSRARKWDIDIAKTTYEKWWLGKMCRPINSSYPFKKVVEIKVIGPPSFVYGTAWIVYEDGTEDCPTGTNRFRPRKQDIEIQQ